MNDLFALAIAAFAIFVGGVMVGRAFGRMQGQDEARHWWTRDDSDEPTGV
jgi:hypothetical protein